MQINGKCVDKIVSAANFAMYSSNSKCPQISSSMKSLEISEIRVNSKDFEIRTPFLGSW